MTKTEATKKAKVLAKVLGKGWKINIWDNLGWHYRVHLDNKIHVAESSVPFGGDTRYYVSVGEGGSMLAMFAPEFKSYTNPILAVKETVRAYEANLDEFIEREENLLKAGLAYIRDLT